MKKLLFIGIYFLLLNSWSQNSPYSLSLQGGSLMPNSDFSQFSQNGFTGSLGLTKQIHKNWSLFLSADIEQMKTVNKDDNWQQYSLNIGPVYRLTDTKIKTDIYAQIGYARQNIPLIEKNYPDSNVLVQQISGGNSNMLRGVIGVKLGYAISSRVNLFVKPQYSTGFSNISYQTRDVSPAINERGILDVEAANSIPFQRQSFNTNSGSISIGIDINFATDWNSTRSNKTSKTT